ncbi:HIRAN domain-containing protein [Sphingomonas abaci]|uniref:HIRAN domain-containing protein n=1 Tax=Sphingomonas abaci TaxID=237611 RepID=A0A7W7AM54_9SPHN|nr:hypothetical protein [Sphingomonas abaci]
MGITYPNKSGPTRRFELQLCAPGEVVELRPEPKNPYDEHAIAVFSCRGVQLGYLPSERAVFIGTLTRQGHTVKAIFQGLTQTVGWVRVAFDGEEPALPAPTQRATIADDCGFWPDDLGGEWGA